MKYRYKLEIRCDVENIDYVSKYLGTAPSYKSPLGWVYSLTQADGDAYIDFINIFLDLLEGKYDLLSKRGIEKPYISIFMLYEYDGQCNMEFRPEDMKRIGEHGIGFCISCWEKGEPQGKS